jgi:hypothetical protein
MQPNNKGQMYGPWPQGIEARHNGRYCATLDEEGNKKKKKLVETQKREW